MPKLSKVLAGKKAKHAGNVFEHWLKVTALSQRFEVIQIPNGCKTLGKNRLIRVKTPFDMLIAKDREVVFLDAKSCAGKCFSRSAITPHQAFALSGLEGQGFLAGYLVHFTTLNIVSFFSATHLLNLKLNDSLKPEQGIVIGNSKEMNLNLLLGE